MKGYKKMHCDSSTPKLMSKFLLICSIFNVMVLPICVCGVVSELSIIIIFMFIERKSTAHQDWSTIFVPIVPFNCYIVVIKLQFESDYFTFRQSYRNRLLSLSISTSISLHLYFYIQRSCLFWRDYWVSAHPTVRQDHCTF